MKILKVDVNGVRTPMANVVEGKAGRYYCLTHGELGRGRWQYRLPISTKDFPVGEETLPLNGEYEMIDLKKEDQKGNPLYLLKKGNNDGKYLVIWSLDPGYRGEAEFMVEGKATILAKGREAQGEAGRMGGAECPILIVDGPCKLIWRRTGRLYGSPSDWVASYDGETWVVSPEDECLLEQAALGG